MWPKRAVLYHEPLPHFSCRLFVFAHARTSPRLRIPIHRRRFIRLRRCKERYGPQ
jgi:hypothetical protein